MHAVNHMHDEATTVETIGDLIRKRREGLGLTLSQLSIETGVHPSFLSRIENDESEPGLETAPRLARALRLDTDMMLNVFGLATTEQRKSATADLKRIADSGMAVDLPVVGVDGEPTGEVKRVELARADDAFILVGKEHPWVGDLVASRTRIPTDGMGVIVSSDGNGTGLRAGYFRKAGRRRSWVEFPDGSRLDYPEQVFAIIRHG